jgi:phytoene/squalene synthetase
VQPVEWPINPLSSQPWWRRLLPDDEPVVETEARELIEHLTKESKGVRIVAVDELLNLERQDIDQFLQASEFDDEQRQYLSGLLTGGPQVPVVIFKTIDDYWREVSGIH